MCCLAQMLCNAGVFDSLMILLMTLFCTNLKIYDFHFNRFLWVARSIIVNQKCEQNLWENLKIVSRYNTHK